MNDVKKLHLLSLFAGMYFYTPIMTLFLLQHNINVGLLVAMQTVFSLAMMLAELPTGVLSDKYGQVVSTRLGLLLDAVGMLQLLLIREPVGLFFFFAVRGISVAFRSGSDEALLYDSYLQENKSAAGYAKSYGKFLANDILGFIISAFVAGLAVQLWHDGAYVPMIVLSGVTSLLALGITYTLKTKKQTAKTKQEFNSLSHLRQSLKLVKKDRTIFALAIAGILTLNGEYFLRQSYSPFFEEMAVPALFLGVALGIGKLLNYFVIKYSHVLERFLTIDQIIFGIHLVLGGLFILFAAAKSAWAIVPVFILMQGLFNAERPVVSDYINQRVESFQRSTVLSAVSFLQNFAQMFARLGLGISIALVGIGSTYVVQGIYLILGAAISLWYLRRCGCAHRVHHTDKVTDDLEVAQEVAT